LAAGVHAETSISLGLGPEANMYSEKSIAAGGVFNMDFRFNEMWSVGSRALYCMDLGQDTIGDVSVLEVTANVRWYFLRFRDMMFKYSMLWMGRFHWFVQIDAGGSFAYFSKIMEDVAYTGLSIGGTGGARIVFEKMYIEPYLRYSIKGHLGIGVLFGLTFNGNGNSY
jgi:hypothetical protein